ncbi:MAG: CPXCG motif-containing cysteine-rich protein [Natronospirillum sp.]|uniref:CPXCG motif-containing cysteine-rich protein n=1 Tax=Natronospirillum sp. TaxID=2812955 RepID=UPI0025CFF5B5|nr:CPXCG motif-containing cysteine-rich protein [Natronospirillum sp.]MCH8550775.1 CPXCG motif-containing cysteine-rich protein [Natronospirillum sp.]
MQITDTAKVHCPYCDALQTVVLDPSEPEQEYTEDCQVCCQPMVLTVHFEPMHTPYVVARREDDVHSPGD